MPADNEHIGKIAAVAPQTILCVIARLSPAASVVKAATSPSRRHVTCKRRTAQRENEGKTCEAVRAGKK